MINSNLSTKFKPAINLLLFLLAQLFCVSLVAQEKPNWQIEFNRPVHGYTISRTGIFIAATNDGLQGIDPEKKEVIWTLPQITMVAIERLKPLAGTPFYEINNLTNYKGEEEAKEKITFKTIGGSFLKDMGKSLTKPITTLVDGEEIGRSVIFDPLHGKILFDSKNTGIPYVTEKQFLKDINCILFEGVSEKKKVLGLCDVSNGKMLWVRENRIKRGLFSSLADAKPIVDPGGHLIFEYRDTTFRVSAQTGQYLWQTPTLSASDLILDNNDKQFFYSLAPDRINKINLGDGNILQFHQPLVTDATTGTASPFEVIKHAIKGSVQGNEIFISGHNSFNFFNTGTLLPKWQATATFQPYAVKEANQQADGNYLVSLTNRLTGEIAIAITDSAGSAKWKVPYKMQGAQIRFLEYTTSGIVYISDAEVDVVDLSSGISRLGKPVLLQAPESTLFTYSKENNSLGILSGGSLYQMDITKASFNRLVNKFSFKGDESDKRPTRLEGRSGGYFLASEQNVVFINFDGTIKYQHYFRRPGLSEKAQALLARLGGLGLGFAFNNQAQQLTTTLYKSGLMNTADYINTKVFDYKMGGTGSAAVVSDLAVEAFAKTSTRIKLIQSTRSFHLILSKLDSGGIGFIKLDKDTGTPLQTIRLDDKEPTILLDDALVGMYYLSPNEKKLMFYDLK